MKHTLAKVVRVLTAPPIMALCLVLLVAANNHNIFRSDTDMLMALLGLVVIPALAYPIEWLKNGKSNELRSKERHLAFILNLVGYLLFFTFGLLTHATSGLRTISTCYFLAVVILTIINKMTPFHASGHACCVSGALILTLYLVSWKWLGACVIIGTLMVWASLELRRHTPKELLLGLVALLLAFGVTLIIL